MFSEYGVMSVLQMRVMGCKGILMHDPRLDQPQKDGKIYDVVMRDSSGSKSISPHF